MIDKMTVAEHLDIALREDCPTCDGTGVVQNYSGGVVANRAPDGHYDVKCAECGGSGRRWKPGVTIEYETLDYDTLIPSIVFPAEWMEDQ